MPNCQPNPLTPPNINNPHVIWHSRYSLNLSFTWAYMLYLETRRVQIKTIQTETELSQISCIGF